MRIEIERVTPEKARLWLEGQRDNRSIRWPQVRQWASDMRRGEFPAIAQPIMFDAENRLIDGQHRLLAVIEAGVSVDLFVARGVPLEHRRYIDSGVTRSAGDVLRMEYGVPNRNHVTAVSALVMQSERHPDKVWVYTLRPSKQEIVNDVIKHQDEYVRAVQLGQAATNTTPSGLWLTRTGYATLSVLVERHSQVANLWDEFHEGVSTGIGLLRGDPRLALRSSSTDKRRYTTQWSLLACIKAWNAWTSSDSLQKIYTGSAKYLPMPEVN